MENKQLKDGEFVSIEVDGKTYTARYRRSEFKGTEWYEWKAASGGLMYARTTEELIQKIIRKEKKL